MGRVSWSPISSELANILPIDPMHGRVDTEDIGQEPSGPASSQEATEQVFIDKSDSDSCFDNCPGRDFDLSELFGNAHGMKDPDYKEDLKGM
jgi:hypothetical protein